MAKGYTNISIRRDDADLATAIWLSQLDVYKSRGEVVRAGLRRLAEEISYPTDLTPEAIHEANTIRKQLGWPLLGPDGKEPDV